MTQNSLSGSPAAAKGDDRNLVPVDPATAVSFEDQAFLIWKKQKTFIIGCLVGLAVLLIGWFSFRGISAAREASIREAFGAATTIEAKRAFAQEHDGHPLSGLAWLAVADDHFTNARYDEAARAYVSAAGALEEPLLFGRARIGEGVSRLKQGQASEGERLLLAVTADTNVLMAYRAQAFFVLADYAAGQKDIAKTRDTVGRLKALAPNSQWAAMASLLEARLAEENPDTISAPGDLAPVEPTPPAAP